MILLQTLLFVTSCALFSQEAKCQDYSDEDILETFLDILDPFEQVESKSNNRPQCSSHEDCMEALDSIDVVCDQVNGTSQCLLRKCKTDSNCPKGSWCQSHNKMHYCSAETCSQHLDCLRLRHPSPQIESVQLHNRFLQQFLFRFETSSVHFISHESDISQGPIDDLTSKMIFFFAFFAIIDQF